MSFTIVISVILTFPDLNTPVSDATSIADILFQNCGFSEIKLLLDNDANESKVIKALRQYM
jgi:hypothetical protein